MKKCTKCKQTKELTEFHKDKSHPQGVYSMCLLCKRESKRQLRKDRLKQIEEIKVSRGCENPECEWEGEFDPCMLDFDHVDRDDKTGSVSHMLLVAQRPMRVVLNEIAKCMVLCANCHRMKTKMEYSDVKEDC